MMVWSLFIIGLMGVFFYNKIGSIIPKVVLPTTEIIEPKLFSLFVYTSVTSSSHKLCMNILKNSTAYI